MINKRYSNKNDAKTIYLLISGDKVVGEGKLRG